MRDRDRIRACSQGSLYICKKRNRSHTQTHNKNNTTPDTTITTRRCLYVNIDSYMQIYDR